MAEFPAEELEGSLIALSLDDFAFVSNVSTEEKNTVMTSSMNGSSVLSKSLYGQVVFHDLCEVYPTDSDIKCRYSLTDNVNPQPGDKIALFKVGWISVSQYIAFERAQLPDNSRSTILQVTFPATTLPKDDVDLYQLCYVTSGNVIAGASVPFGFRKPVVTELVAVEDPTDPGLLVYKSRVTQLQDDLSKVIEEKESLNNQYTSLQISLETKEKELLTVLDKNGYLKDEVESLQIELKKLQEINKVVEEKESLNNQCISLQVSLETKEKELLTVLDKNRHLKDEVESLQIELKKLQETNKDQRLIDERFKELLSENATLMAEKSTFEERIKKMSEMHNKTVLENLELSGALDEANKTVEELQKRLEDMKGLLQNLCDENESNLKEALCRSEEEKTILQAQLYTLNEHHVKCKQTVANAIEREETALRKCQEIEELNKETISKLKEQNKLLHSEVASLKTNPFVSTPRSVSSLAKDFISELFQDYETPGTGMSQNEHEVNQLQILKDEKCRIQSRLTSVLQEKADLRAELVQVKHANESLHKMIEENKEEQAALKSRISVLEYELRNGKSEEFSCNLYNADCAVALNETLTEFKISLEKLTEATAIIDKFNLIMKEKSVIEEKLSQEKKQRLIYQKKVEHLLLRDADMFNELTHMKDEYSKLLSEKTYIEARRDALHEETLKEKVSLENKLMEVRKEMVGRVSLVEAQHLRKEVASLKEKIQNKECCSDLNQKLQLSGVKFAKLLQALKRNNLKEAEEVEALRIDVKTYSAENLTVCPLCHMQFPPGSYESFDKHFVNHLN